jgi:hypothetical protein
LINRKKKALNFKLISRAGIGAKADHWTKKRAARF